MIQILELEEWLEMPNGSGMTMEEFMNMEFAESGADREMDFNLETEQEKRYENYVEAMKAYPLYAGENYVEQI